MVYERPSRRGKGREMTHDELKAKVDRLHTLMADPSEGSILYQVAVGGLVQDLCDAWGRPEPAKVARAALEAAIEVVHGERLYQPSNSDGYMGYQQAIRDAEAAIRGHRDTEGTIAAIVEAARKAP